MFVRQSDILTERRGPLRVKVRQRVWCTFNGKTMRCESHDLSRTGVRLGAPRFLPVGTKVEIKPDHASPLVGRRRLLAQVVWARPEDPDEACLGLEFCEPTPFDGSWAAAAYHEAVKHGLPQPRRTRRHAQQVRVTLLDAGREFLGRGVTADLSLGGMCLLTETRPERGEGLIAQLHISSSRTLDLPCHFLCAEDDRIRLRFYTLAPAQQRELNRFLCGRSNWVNRLVRKLFA